MVGGWELQDVLRRNEIVRLGAGVDRTGRLDPAAIERTRVALADYARDIARLGAGHVRMVATSATRDAANAGEFVAMVRGTLGVDPEVLTGEQEAHLSFTGATRGTPGLRAPVLVVDVGGGSTEFSLGDPPGPEGSAGRVRASCSQDIGCVRMTERHLRSDPPTAAEVAAARTDVRAALTRAGTIVDFAAARTLVGLAGSVTTVAALVLELATYDPERIHGTAVGVADVVRVSSWLLGLSREQRAGLPVMHPGRVDVIGAGALIVAEVAVRVGLEYLVASEHDILDGVAWSMVDDLPTQADPDPGARGAGGAASTT